MEMVEISDDPYEVLHYTLLVVGAMGCAGCPTADRVSEMLAFLGT